jgi:hypothetical protein
MQSTWQKQTVQRRKRKGGCEDVERHETAKKKWSFGYISFTLKDKCKLLSEDIHKEEVAKV